LKSEVSKNSPEYSLFLRAENFQKHCVCQHLCFANCFFRNKASHVCFISTKSICKTEFCLNFSTKRIGRLFEDFPPQQVFPLHVLKTKNLSRSNYVNQMIFCSPKTTSKGNQPSRMTAREDWAEYLRFTLYHLPHESLSSTQFLSYLIALKHQKGCLATDEKKARKPQSIPKEIFHRKSICCVNNTKLFTDISKSHGASEAGRKGGELEF
jgi:hypothetical protein